MPHIHTHTHTHRYKSTKIQYRSLQTPNLTPIQLSNVFSVLHPHPQLSPPRSTYPPPPPSRPSQIDAQTPPPPPHYPTRYLRNQLRIRYHHPSSLFFFFFFFFYFYFYFFSRLLLSSSCSCPLRVSLVFSSICFSLRGRFGGFGLVGRGAKEGRKGM